MTRTLCIWILFEYNLIEINNCFNLVLTLNNRPRIEYTFWCVGLWGLTFQWTFLFPFCRVSLSLKQLKNFFIQRAIPNQIKRFPKKKTWKWIRLSSLATAMNAKMKILRGRSQGVASNYLATRTSIAFPRQLPCHGLPRHLLYRKQPSGLLYTLLILFCAVPLFLGQLR